MTDARPYWGHRTMGETQKGAGHYPFGVSEGREYGGPDVYHAAAAPVAAVEPENASVENEPALPACKPDWRVAGLAAGLAAGPAAGPVAAGLVDVVAAGLVDVVVAGLVGVVAEPVAVELVAEIVGCEDRWLSNQPVAAAAVVVVVVDD